MDLQLRTALTKAIVAHPSHDRVISQLEFNPDGTGTIKYKIENVWIDPAAPGFSAGETRITDEELVRAYLLLKLSEDLGYEANGRRIEMEKVYKPVGRPMGKGGRVDLVVRGTKRDSDSPDAFLFIECKAPEKFDQDLKYIDGQLFRLSRQEPNRPRYLVYYTVELKSDALRERLILIDTQTYPEYQNWDDEGQPITDTLPAGYGIATKLLYGNVQEATKELRPLDIDASAAQFSRLQNEIHDVIWSGGGTNNNEVFVLITRLILAKIYDEKETLPNHRYRFQRYGNAVTPESPDALVSRLNKLYRDAEDAYLALPHPSVGPAFDTSRIASEKIAYVVGRLESISVTENNHSGDILGEFFEQIIASDFTQTKGQFFTPVKVIRFILELCEAVDQAKKTMSSSRDHLGRPRLPYVMDPSCGSGSFLIEYMKLIRSEIGTPEVAAEQPGRVRESHGTWFSGPTGNAWARDFLFGIENNYDLGLAAKVNMVLHGDGSMNTWIASGILPFEEYQIEGRRDVLGNKIDQDSHPYSAPRNEQFDLIISNPPFSLKLSPDEKQKIERSFEIMKKGQSEAIFVERWYQLLREGGRFVCVLPEAILDTSTSRRMREFLLQYFRIEAVVALPYDAFRPFTSTKTSILMASKRSVSEVRDFQRIFTRAKKTHSDPDTAMSRTLDELGWNDEFIFMAEPDSVGYKRRKNLPDLPTPNRLYREAVDGSVDSTNTENPTTVLDAYKLGRNGFCDPTLGFWVQLGDVCQRPGLRLDPKYRWLWDHSQGVATGSLETSKPLSEYIEIVPLPKVSKGDLATDTRLIDLEWVESRQALLNPDVPSVDTIGSDKVLFDNCELAFSKLEPYLGKVLLDPSPNDLGSTEWVGLRTKGGVPPLMAAYLLMQQPVCDAFRRLQSGKRHARLDPSEMLDLKIEIPPIEDWAKVVDMLQARRAEILRLRLEAQKVRASIDESLEVTLLAEKS